MIKCTNCSHENADETLICEACGYLIGQATTDTRQYDDTDYEEGTPKWGDARFDESNHLVIDVLESGQSFIFDFEETKQIIIGRKKDEDTQTPFLDLTNADAREKGVSRRHAQIIRREEALHIVDSESANGTFLNGHKLVPHQPRVMRDGDDIRLGFLTVRITYGENR